jgi:hypothetical protein
MSPRYDVFLSHASADKEAVEYLARKLRKAGIEPLPLRQQRQPAHILILEGVASANRH